MNKKKRIQYIGIIIVLVLSITFYLKYRHSSTQMSPEAVSVETEKVKVGDVPIEAKAIGTLSADKSVEITPEFPGQIAEIYFKDGAYIKQGTPLIQLDDKVKKAKSESTKAALFYSETNYKRMLLLGKQGAISKQAIESAQAELKQKQADAQENQVTVDKMKLLAPFDGVVAKSLVSVGDHVTSGQSLVTLTDIQHLRVEYSVSEKYLSQLKLGQTVKITTSAYPDKVFTGIVAYISPTINTDNRTLSLYAEINNENKLLTAGLFVNLTQSLGIQHNAKLVSPQSLVATIDGQKIFKVVNGKAVSTMVVIGQRTNEMVQINQGIEDNDVVITAGQEKLKDGMPVNINLAQKNSLT